MAEPTADRPAIPASEDDIVMTFPDDDAPLEVYTPDTDAEPSARDSGADKARYHVVDKVLADIPRPPALPGRNTYIVACLAAAALAAVTLLLPWQHGVLYNEDGVLHSASAGIATMDNGPKVVLMLIVAAVAVAATAFKRWSSIGVVASMIAYWVTSRTSLMAASLAYKTESQTNAAYSAASGLTVANMLAWALLLVGVLTAVHVAKLNHRWRVSHTGVMIPLRLLDSVANASRYVQARRVELEQAAKARDADTGRTATRTR